MCKKDNKSSISKILATDDNIKDKIDSEEDGDDELSKDKKLNEVMKVGTKNYRKLYKLNLKTQLLFLFKKKLKKTLKKFKRKRNFKQRIKKVYLIQNQISKIKRKLHYWQRI